MFDIETKLGDIHFSSNIINKIVEKAVEGCGGKVMLQNYKGGLNAASVEVTRNDDGYALKVYVMLKFGTSIKAATTEIIDSIYENTEIILGQKPENVTVVVTGVVSKNIAKRHIEVSR